MKRKTISVLLALALVLSFSLVAAVPAGAIGGTTWYVATTGNNTNDGLTPETPWRDIQYAIDNENVLGGDTILVYPGEYVIDEPATEYACIIIDVEALTVKALNPAATLVDPLDPSVASKIVAGDIAWVVDEADVINIAADDITFNGFTVVGADYSGVDIYGVDIYDWEYGAVYFDCIITNNYITGSSENGIYVDGTGHTISGNITTGNGDGIWVDGEGHTILNNIITDNEWSGIYIDEDSAAISISGNNFQNNGVQLTDGTAVLNIEQVLANNVFDRAVVVDRLGDYLRFIWSSIQDGIDAAVGGDTVNVADGTYYELITLKDGVQVLGAGEGISIISGTGLSGSVVTATSVTSATKLDGFTITGGTGTSLEEESYGGGMYIVNSSPTVSNCTFSGNTAQEGGGMYNDGSSPTVTNCTFSGNSALWCGGMSNVGSSPTVTNCTFLNNTATGGNGGGMANDGSSPTVTNGTFSGNTASVSGGGMSNYASLPTVTNCTFSGNSATQTGGGMYNVGGSSPTVTNCILWGNEATSGPKEIYNSGANPLVTYCDVQVDPVYTGDGNINTDPLFVDANGADNTFGTPDDDLHLTAGSPCIDAGNDLAPSIPTTDFEGDDRIMGAAVDMGADEAPAAAPNNDPNAPGFPLCEGEANPPGVTDPTPEFSWTFSDPDAGDTQGAYQILVSSGQEGTGDKWDPGMVAGDASVVSYDGTALAQNTTYYWKVKTWDNLDAAGPYCDEQQFTMAPSPSEVWVATTGNDDNAGTQESPFLTIQKGITAVASPGTVHVADGAYNEDITLKNEVQVLGAGEASTTINGTGTGSVVTASGVGPTTKLDGFTVTGGDTNTTGGGGMYIVNSSLTVSNCTFDSNTASGTGIPSGVGGGMHNLNSSPTITNCTFSGNTAGQPGAGMCNNNSSPTITNCTFFGNETTFGGGGMYNRNGGTPTVTDCTFYNNTGSYGAGMYNYASSATVTNCTFYSNRGQDGGGMYDSNSSSEVTNCIFYGNRASGRGGGMFIRDSSPTVTNCTFSGNSAYYYGGAIFSQHLSTATVTNCILWGDSVQVHEGPEIYDYVDPTFPSVTTVNYSDVQGGWPGTGNKNAYPWFSNPAAGDYHLESGSPCIDAGNSAAVPSGVTTDFEGDPRIIGAAVDMGADESLPYEVWVATTGSDTNPGTWSLPFATIQMGIDTVAEGGMVNVAAGTYDEQVIIDKALTLQGAGDTTIIQPSGPELIPTTSIPWINAGTGTMSAIVSVETTGDEVTIRDLEIDGSLITSKSTTWVAGLVYLETSGKIEGVTVNGGSTLPDRTAGIFAAAIVEPTILEVTGCTVEVYTRAGIYALGAQLTADYHHNEINGPGSISTGVPNGMFFLEGVNGSATYNTVTDLGYTGVGEYRSTGIGTYNAGTDVTFAYNTISYVQNAFALSTGTIGTIVEYNNIFNNHTGVRIEANAASSIIQYNDIHDNDFAIRCGAAMGDGNEAHYNNFVGNPGVLWVNEDEAVPNTYVGAVCNVHETYTLDATNNWWGDASGPSGEGTGTGDAVSTNVDFTPWLDAEYYPVEINGVGYDTIQDAVDAASPDDTITVNPGTYVGDITVSKNLTLVSSGGAEVTKLTGTGLNPVVTVGDYTVTIDGFEIDPGTDGVRISTIGALNEVTIQNAVIHGNADDGIEVGTVYGTLNILDNVIAENNYGVYLPEVDEGGIVNVKGNAIGAWQDDTYDFAGNSYEGILIGGIYGESTVTIGGDEAAEANIIAENAYGVHLIAVDEGGIVNVKGNAIGAWQDADYNLAGNTYEGILIDYIYDGSTVTIGGATEAEANFICENGDEGIYVNELYRGSTLTIEGNAIGAFAHDGYTFNGNGDEGIYIDDVDYGSTLTIKDNVISDAQSEEGIEIYQVGFDDSSFTVDEYYALYQIHGANYVTIEGNTITDNSNDGLYISYADFATYITIEDNVFSGNGDDGITMEYFGQYGYDYYLDDDTASVHQDPDYPDYFGPVALVKGNTITDNEDDGIYQYDDWEYGTSVTIEDNVITGNLAAGIYHSCDVINDAHVIIRGNTIASNGWNGGIYWSSDEYIDYASSYTVENNLIAGNQGDGMYIYGVCDDSTLTIRGNTIGAGADAQGSQYPANDGYGIYIEYVDYYSTAEISGNTISGNSDDGIDIEYVYEYGSANITSNIITENDDGIYIDYVYDDGSVSITHNDILDNGHGIDIYDVYVSSTAGSLEAHYNNIVGNSSYGVYYSYSSSDEYVDASNNWWGDATGPKQATTNPCASGDEASDNVGYTPWLDATYPGGTERYHNVENITQVTTHNSIQAAIDHAQTQAGDTISVAAGTYAEALFIDDSLTLLGAKAGVDARTRDTSSGESIVDGSGLELDAGVGAFNIADGVSGVIIDGFEICNWPASSNPGNGSAVMAYSYGAATQGLSQITIQNNYMYDLGWNGVLVWSNNNVVQDDFTIQFNLIEEAPYAAIELTNVTNSQVLNNKIIAPTVLAPDPGDAGVGIEVAVRAQAGITISAGNVLVEGNEISGTFPEGSRAGINILSRTYASDSVATLTGVTVRGNTVSANVIVGILAVAESRDDGPATISNLQIVDDNIVSNFTKTGIVVKDVLSVQIEGNIISSPDNSKAATNGIQVGYLDEFWAPATTGTTGTVNGNQVSGCHWEEYDPQTETYEDDYTASGILVIDTESALEISGNEVQSCDVGLDIEAGSGTLITNNDVHDNSYGFVLWNANPTISFNNIYQNALGGVYRTTQVEQVGILDATNNWWGDATGPQHATLNSEGQGNAVSDNVSFDPWLPKWYPTEPLAPPPPPTIDTELFDTEASFETNSDGEIQETIVATSEDENVTITIEAGTIALDAEGKPLSTLTAAVEPSPPEPPEGTYLIGAYDFGPDGATFDPPITLTWSYDPETLPEDVDLVIAYYDEVNEEWVWVPCEVDTENNIITASVAHFTTFTIIAVPAELPPAPAAFTVSSLSISPVEVNVGETVTISLVVTNTGGESGSYTVTLDIDGVKEAEETVTVAAGDSQEVSFSVTKEEAGIYSVTVAQLSSSFTVIAPPAPAAFSVSRLSLQPAEVEAAIAVTIVVLVSNTGGTEGSYTAVLKVNGVKETEKTVTIAAGDSQEVSFSVTKEEAGSYTVAVNGLSGSFTVLAPPPGINWAMIGGIIGGVIVVGLLIFVLLRRRVY